MKDAKVISLRGRLAGSAVSSAPEDPQMAKLLDAQTPGICSKCGTAAVIDYADLVAERAKLHCPACQHYWDEPLAEPEDEADRAHLAAYRQAAAIRRHPYA